MKKILSLSFIMVSSLSAMEGGYKIKEFFAQPDIGNVEIYKDSHGFSILKDGEYTQIKRYDIDPLIAKMSDEQLEKFQEVGYLALKKRGEDYSIMAKTRGPGGGAGGATVGFWIGRFAAQTIGYGIVALVALPAIAGGPIAYSVAVAGLAGTCAPLIESASHVAAISTAIVAGVATGPA